jgi:hypothetical protein
MYFYTVSSSSPFWRTNSSFQYFLYIMQFSFTLRTLQMRWNRKKYINWRLVFFSVLPLSPPTFFKYWHSLLASRYSNKLSCEEDFQRLWLIFSERCEDSVGVKTRTANSILVYSGADPGNDNVCISFALPFCCIMVISVITAFLKNQQAPFKQNAYSV